MSSSSSCASSVSLDGGSPIKFVCSYGGKILPRYPDSRLRYFGGDTRVVSVDRSVSFSELLAKLGELCGWSSFSLRCQLPTEDLDALVSVTSDEDLANLIEEYDLSNGPPKIRAFLFESSPPRAPPTTVRSHRCVHHRHHQNQICGAPSRLSGVGGRPPRLCDSSQQQQQHRHHQHPISSNHRYLVHH